MNTDDFETPIEEESRGDRAVNPPADPNHYFHSPIT
jgi:hypothetical protein